MKFILRQYQQEAVDAAVDFLTCPKDENGLEVLPTGSGKSLVIAGIVDRLDAPCLVLQPTQEILAQNFAKFQAYGYHPAIYSASFGKKQIGDITLATIGSIIRKPELFKHVKYIIQDEAHFCNPKEGMYSTLYKMLNGTRILGLTATPYRLVTDGFGGSILKFLTRTRPRVFSKVVYYVQNGDLFNEGFLANVEYKEVKTGFDPTRLRLNSTGADYTDESVRRHFSELNFSDRIVRCVNRLQELGRNGTLVFTRFCEEAEYVKSRIPGAAIVTAETPKKEREEILAGFKAGTVPVVTNVGVLTVGFDYPELANVVLARPTMSLALYYQMVGRGIRIHPLKESTFVIDMVGLVKKFGRVEDLTLDCGPNDTWFIRTGSRQLTNIYYGEKK
jgi:DNA repair protein RadD